MFLGLIFGTASIHLHVICFSQEKQASISLVNQYMSVRPDYISFSSLFSLMAAYIVQKIATLALRDMNSSI